jgi:hypothetical protein
MKKNARKVYATGGCLCAAVTYEVRGPLRPIVACHCRQCRRLSGHFVAATAVKREAFVLTRTQGLRWYHSSDFAQRGFCGICGSNLFWDAQAYPHISIMAGTLDGPTHLSLVKHIFVAEKGDYYDLNDGLPQSTGREHGVRVPEA